MQHCPRTRDIAKTTDQRMSNQNREDFSTNNCGSMDSLHRSGFSIMKKGISGLIRVQPKFCNVLHSIREKGDIYKRDANQAQEDVEYVLVAPKSSASMNES